MSLVLFVHFLACCFYLLDPSSIIHEANKIAITANISCTVSSLNQCNSCYFHDLYNSFTGLSLSFVSCNEEKKCQLVTDALEMLLSPHIQLNHIKGSNLARLDRMTIKHMLDIFSMLFNSLPCEEIQYVNVTPPYSSREEDHTPIQHSTPHAKACSRIFPSHSMYKKSEIQQAGSVTHKGVEYIDRISPVGKKCVLELMLSKYLQDIDPKFKKISSPESTSLSSKSLHMKPDLQIMQDNVQVERKSNVHILLCPSSLSFLFSQLIFYIMSEIISHLFLWSHRLYVI